MLKKENESIKNRNVLIVCRCLTLKASWRRISSNSQKKIREICRIVFSFRICAENKTAQIINLIIFFFFFSNFENIMTLHFDKFRNEKTKFVERFDVELNQYSIDRTYNFIFSIIENLFVVWLRTRFNDRNKCLKKNIDQCDVRYLRIDWNEFNIYIKLMLIAFSKINSHENLIDCWMIVYELTMNQTLNA